MIILLILFTGDSNTLYAMDMTAGVFPVEWDSSFMLPNNGFRTLQGCLDLENWYQEYQAGFNARIYRNMRFCYEYQKVDDYRLNIEKHRFSLRLINGMHYLNIYVIPSFSKKDDEAGIGYGIELDNLWIETDMGVYQFDNNYYFSKVELTTETPFVRYPITASVKLFLKQRGYTKLDIMKIFTCEKLVVHNGVHIGSIYQGESHIELRNYFSINKRLGTDIYLKFREFNAWVSDNSVSVIMPDVANYYENSSFGLLFLRYHWNSKNYIQIGPSIEMHRYFSDTLNYWRRYLLFNAFWKKCFGIPFVTLGLQFSSRTIEENSIVSKNTEARGIIESGFDFNKKTHFSIIEGIELDDISGIKNGINRLHNHTYVQLSYTF